MKRYFPNEIESKWQKKWNDQGLYKFNSNSKTKKGKYYNLVELPYPSGDLHLGHWFAFAVPDVHARFKRMSGFNVFFPNGYDAFGLPAENAAIKRGIHPKDWTLNNIKTMTKQFSTMGTMIDWDALVITCLPKYYVWNQWIFLKMFQKGIAYRGKALSNWCPVDQTVLANEHIENGKCWRCGSEVVQKEVEQWFLKITDFADRLIWQQNSSFDWPKEVMDGQNNWIGKSEGLLLDFKVKDSKSTLQVFTTRPETTDGATFLVIAPEHPFAKNLELAEVKNYIEKSEKKTEMQRKEDRTKSGIFTEKYAINPATGKEIPIWVSDYVLAGYGTGAVMGVPFADKRDGEFAQKFSIPIIETGFNARPTGIRKTNYHLRDTSISRQRYWGTPVPIIHCEKCGLVPVDDKDLPIELPYDVDFTPKGKPPLASDEKWLNVKCPNCQGPAKRDAETLDTFFDSSWYYYRYCSPNFDKGPFSKEIVESLMPVDVYFGGSEHTLGHTLYARFFTKFFKDLGLVDFEEFALKRVQHGVILGPDGNRMSKSKGNVVNPDDIVKEYGADTVRLYLCFMMPYESTAPWSTTAISGVYRFLKKVWDMAENVDSKSDKLSKEDLFYMHSTIKKVGEDLENFRFNTSVSSLMKWLNHLSTKTKISNEEYKNLLLLLAPLAPHVTEELWQLKKYSANPARNTLHSNAGGSIHLTNWPEYDKKHLEEQQAEIAITVNGKLRDSLKIESTKSSDQKLIEDRAMESEKVKKYITGPVKKVIFVEGKLINFVV